MKRIRQYRIWLTCIAIAAVCAGIIYYIHYVRKNIPDKIYMDSFSDGTIEVGLPFVGTVKSEEEAVPVAVNLMEPLTINSGDVSEYKFTVNLFGTIPIKEISVSVNNTRHVIACGIPVGISIDTDGICVVDTGDVTTSMGVIEAPARGILMAGDYIYSVNGKNVYTIRELMDEISSGGSEYLCLGVRRNGENIETRIKPVCDSDGVYKIGVWVRDDCQGLGTLTYVDEDNDFGTLGHSISDSTSGKAVEIKSGRLYTAHIWSIVKGKEGKPGEVIGSINYGEDNYIGDIEENSDIGVYGKANDNIKAYVDNVYMQVAYKQDIEEGEAFVRTFADGSIKDYAIDITEIHFSEDYRNKGIVFTVTDEKLLSCTGGIVQGMSGSPIIQNGKVIGAVTHVFVNEPEKGYGIFIEEMLEH